MKAFFKFLLVTIFILGVGLWVFRQFFLNTFLHNYIEIDLAAKADAHIQTNQVNLESLFPPRLVFDKFNFRQNNGILSVSLKKLIFEVAQSESGGVLVRAEAVKPDVTYIVPEKQANQKTDVATGTMAGTNLEPLMVFNNGIELQVKDATVTTKFKRKGGADAAVVFKQIYFYAIKNQVGDLAEPFVVELSGKTDMTWGEYSLPIPFSFETEKLFYDANNIRSDLAQLKIAGVNFDVSGKTNITEMAHSWKGQILIEDMAKMRIAPEFLPPGKWQGGVSANFSFLQEPDSKPLLTGDVATQNLRGDLKVSEALYEVNGPVEIDLKSQFSYKNDFRLPQLEGQVVMTKASVKNQNFLSKPRGIPLLLKFNGSYNGQNFDLREALLQFHTLKASARGKLTNLPLTPSNMQVQIQPTNLVGYEKYIPLLDKKPVTGKLELNAQAAGDFQRIETVKVNIPSVKLQGFRGRIKYEDKKAGVSVVGPFAANIVGSGALQGQKLINAQAKTFLNLSAMNIRYKKLFYKKVKETFVLNINAQQERDIFRLKPSRVTLPAGDVLLSGTLKGVQDPEVAVGLQVSKFNILKVLNMFPEYKKFGVSGVVNSRLSLRGKYEQKKGIEDSPLKVTGYISAFLPKYEVKTKATEGEGGDSGFEAATGPVPSILPPWPIFRKSKLNIQVKLKELLLNDLKVSGIEAKGVLNKGNYNTKLNVDRLFGGKLKFKSLSTDLMTPLAPFYFKGTFLRIQMKPALNWVLPEWKDAVSGFASGNINGQMPDPRGGGVMENVRAEGKLVLSDTFVSTLQFDQMANKALKKIKKLGVKAKPLNSKGAKFSATGDFSLESGVVQFNPLNMVTPENNQLYVKGQVGLDMQVDLKGDIFLADAQIPRNIRNGNTDSKGRFRAPMDIKGSLLNPEMSFAQKTIERIIANSLKYQRKKAEKKAKVQLKKDLKKQGKKIEQDLKKELKKLFK